MVESEKFVLPLETDMANSPLLFVLKALTVLICCCGYIPSYCFVGSLYLNLKPKEPIRRFKMHKGRGWIAGFSNPVVVNTLVGVLSTLEMLAVFLFILVLAWNFYARILNVFKNLKPSKSLALSS
ncbi:hypothetical protein DVH24_039664 [Malus domestica]|uniref:Uncharacterized protein n=1 Tax=Malus domestica TaxID=3750 RepID=A0A498I9C7_MALDO|nr:hypothetical protein DVH24_039664 [Malus domestica]